jgi:peptidoglycan/xylan/chitin deacetylase (PgdA/CDA1 family)
MTVTTAHFEQQLDLLFRNNFEVISLADFVAWKLGHENAVPARSVVLTFDDGHASVYREARSILTKNRLPATIFAYPSCISRASYAMTWDQLSEMAATPLFTVQSHTFWHPNFKQESKRLNRVAYGTFVERQLRQSKAVIEQKLARPVTFLAWPFGIYDPYLIEQATAAGYRAAFSIECRAAKRSDPIMAIPRCLVSDEDIGGRFIRLLDSAIQSAKN